MLHRRLLNVAGWVTATAAVATAAVAGFTAWSISAVRRPWPPYTFTPFEIGAEASEVEFTAEDGVRLRGWWFDRDSDSVVICCHGHRGNKADMLGIGPGLWRAGHNVLLFDFRGSGDSEGSHLSMALHEQRDLRAAIDLAQQRRPDARISVVGFSMGASTAILTAADDQRIERLVLDSPFATMQDVIATGLRRYRIPGTVVPAADAVNRVRYGYRFAQVRPIDVIDRIAPRPMLVLHGTDDHVIPYRHAEMLVEAAGPGAAELVTFEGVDHCGGYFTDRPGYIAMVDEFLRR
ncbi:alpha/beta hydrolase [Enemella sp. A6]|uniref:alpha/beta hydrolase n=1 Tax=Enemella sp. A6 TaxID=3440152 RepID=UPI003EBFEECC